LSLCEKYFILKMRYFLIFSNENTNFFFSFFFSPVKIYEMLLTNSPYVGDAPHAINESSAVIIIDVKLVPTPEIFHPDRS
jgi:hypothetical protein